MKLVFNISNLNGPGVDQIAQSFLEECRNDIIREYHIFISKRILANFKLGSFPDHFKFYIIKKSPARSLKSILYLKSLEKLIKPDCVFSLFGPTYWTPKAPHLMGFALPFFIYRESPFFKNYPASLLKRLEKKIKMFFVLANTKYYHVETIDIKNRLISDYKIEENYIFHVNGTYNQIYGKPILPSLSLLPKKKKGEFRFVTIAAFYKYKNLEIINEIIKLLRVEKYTKVKFVLTIDPILLKKHFGENSDYIYNLGPVRIEECPIIYSECDATFMPSLMESFTSTFPDSMKMKKPIIATDLGFAKSVCEDAAIYYDPLSANSAFKMIKKLIHDDNLRKELIINGQKVLKKFGTAADRAKKFLAILDKIKI